MAKSVLPLAATTFTGTGLAWWLASDYIVQVAGMIIGVLGLIVAIWRCWEIKRATDFGKFKWEEEHAINTHSKEKESSNKEKPRRFMRKEKTR